jgi:hypothetical protein
VGQNLIAERDAEVADIDVRRAGHEAYFSLLLAAERAAAHRAIHDADYLKAAL